MTEIARMESLRREMTVSEEDDDDVYEDDSDFEYLSVPSYVYNEDYAAKGHTSEATPLCSQQKGKALSSYKSLRVQHSDLQIPFSAIHKRPLPYNSDDLSGFIPGVRVDLEITDVERTEHKVLNPNLYTIKLSHGNFTWTIKKRYKHFRSLHDDLILFRAKLHLPVPTRRHRMRRQSFKQRRESLPRFPRRPEILVDEDDIPERKKQLATYLQRILRIPPLRNHHETMRFFEVSHLSFVTGLGAKYHEGLIKKRSGGRSITGCCSCGAFCIKNLTAHYNKRWLVLKDTFLAYVNPHRGTVSDVLLLDGSFSIECGLMNTGVHHGLQITSLNRTLMLKGWTQRNAIEWTEAISNVAETVAKDFTTPNRYNSYAPQRPNGHAQWFVDGAGYMAAVADAMEAAKEEIFITDWWLSPEIYMKRPMTEGDRWRLDVILKRKAAEGVKIFVILFKELEVALGINSYYTKAALLKLHPTNIKVLRHPDGLLLWSHHEKMVVVDQRIAFLGGIDLCYGRYDTPAHRLVDLGSIKAQKFVGHPYLGAVQHHLMSMLTDLGSILTSPDMETPSHLPLSPRNSAISMTARMPYTPPPPPLVDRSISSHSWPETDSDRQKMGLVHRRGSDDEPDSDQRWGVSPRKQLTTISEGSVQSVVPEIVLEGIHLEETDTDPVPTEETTQGPSSSSPQDQIESNVQSEKLHTSRSAPECTHPTSNGIKSQTNQNEPKDSPKAPDQADHVNIKVPKDTNLTRETSTESGHVNHAAEFTPIHEAHPPQTEPTEDNPEEIVVVEKVQIVSAPPPDTQKGEDSGINNNVQDKKEGSSEVDGQSRAPPGGGWKKLKAIQYLQRWQRGREPEEEAASGGGGKKRPPNLVLHRQGRFDEDAPDLLGLPPGTIKPSTPKPRKKIQNMITIVESSTLLSIYPNEAQKAHDMKEDFKDRFRKKQSKSVDVTGDMEFDFSFYKTLEDKDQPEGILEDLGLEGSTKIWIGKDYVNFISKDFVELDKPFTDFIDRTKTPRMPWHDIGAVVYGKPARDVARHFIQRWNFSKVEKRKTNTGYPLLVPKCYTKVTVPRGALASSIPCKVQVLRSSTTWSAGIAETDCSIHNAYIDLINNAQHFIYIENQFFISIMEHDQVENKIAECLFKRIMKAHNAGEVFRVYVVMPLLPAFEGEMGTPTGGAIQAIQHWNYASICREGKSLLERLATRIPDPSVYISFYGLRSHDELGGKLVTELIYVHSKMMIVDDRFVIIGSANINDRSMLGMRDSEMAIITEDTHTRKSRMDGQDYEAGWFASGLRQALFREHLGVSVTNPDINVIDPVCDSFYRDQWQQQATTNTQVYEEVFRCIPTDEVSTFAELTEYQKREGLAQLSPPTARQRLVNVRGNIVHFPLKFLSGSRLQPSVTVKEGLAPVAMWT